MLLGILYLWGLKNPIKKNFSYMYNKVLSLGGEITLIKVIQAYLLYYLYFSFSLFVYSVISFSVYCARYLLKGHWSSASLTEGGKEVISPSTLTFAVRRGTLRIYSIQNPHEIF